MALNIQALGDSPCSISRGIGGVAADGAFRRVRVGLANTPLPAGYTGDGSLDNPVFFRKVLEASLTLIGSSNPNDLSNVELANIFFLATRAGNTALQAQLQAVYPNGKLLEAPFVENASAMVFASTPAFIQPQWGAVGFENTGGTSAPTYCDFIFIVSTDVGQDDSGLYIVKLFHSLTA
jgi:hypothetical protein